MNEDSRCQNWTTGFELNENENTVIHNRPAKINLQVNDLELSLHMKLECMNGYTIKRLMNSWTQNIPWRKSAGSVCSSSLQTHVVICFITNSFAPSSPQLLCGDLLCLVPALAASRSINAWGRHKRRNEERDRQRRKSERRPGLMNKTAAAAHWGPTWGYFSSRLQCFHLNSSSPSCSLCPDDCSGSPDLQKQERPGPDDHRSTTALLKKRNTANPQWNSRQNTCLTVILTLPLIISFQMNWNTV